MKYAIILLTMFLTNVVAKAETCDTRIGEEQVLEQAVISTDVPNHLKGAKIIVRLADGRESEVPAEKFKVVPRLQQYLVTKVSKSTVKSCTKLDDRRHRVSLMAGEAPTGHLDRDGNAAKTTVESERGIVGGAQYQYRTGIRVLDLPVSVGGQLQSNESGAVLLGVDF